jgi:shikimate kinase
MKGVGQARSYGAVSILNAFSTGKGGALSIDLLTSAKVTLHAGNSRVSGFIDALPDESTKLVVTIVERILEHYGHREKIGGEVFTWSNIPPAVGLKSSSAAANATALATASALGIDPDDNLLLNIGIDTAIETGNSVTGAFDDSFASYYGGAVLTDNQTRRVEKKIAIPPGLRVMILVPPRKTYTGKIDKSKFAVIRGLAEIAYKEAFDSHVWEALTLNGLACASVLGEDPRPALAALEAGALGAGLSGKGPAVAAITNVDHVENVKEAWKTYPGDILVCSPNTKKAMIEE